MEEIAISKRHPREILACSTVESRFFDDAVPTLQLTLFLKNQSGLR